MTRVTKTEEGIRVYNKISHRIGAGLETPLVE